MAVGNTSAPHGTLAHINTIARILEDHFRFHHNGVLTDTPHLLKYLQGVFEML